MKKIFPIIFSLFLLTGCEQKPTEEKLIFSKLSEHFKSHPACFFYEGVNNSFPLIIKYPYAEFKYETSLALQILSNNKLVSVDTITNDNKNLVINLTEKGKKLNAWTKDKGFCFGHKEVEDVLLVGKNNIYKSFNGDIRKDVTLVFYKWKFVDSPSWFKDDSEHKNTYSSSVFIFKNSNGDFEILP